MWRLGGAFWTWKDYDAKDHIRERIFNALEEQKQRLFDGFRKLDIHEREDIEPYIDRIAEQVKQAQLKQQNWLKLEPYYTKRELGLRNVREVDPIGDKGGDEIQINRAIQKIGRVSSKVSGRKRRKARELLETIASAGYYGYLVLRRKLGIPLEHPTLRPWYARFLPWIPQLINPGGIVFVKEGTYFLSDRIPLNESNIVLEGVGWGSELKAVSDTSTGNIIELIGDSDFYNVFIKELKINGAGLISGAAVKIQGGIDSDHDINMNNYGLIRVKIENVNKGVDGTALYLVNINEQLNGFFYKNLIQNTSASPGGISCRVEDRPTGWIAISNTCIDCDDNIRNCQVAVGNVAIRSGEFFAGHISVANRLYDSNVTFGAYDRQLFAYNWIWGRNITPYTYDRVGRAIIGNIIDVQGTARFGIRVVKGTYNIIAENTILNAGQEAIKVERFRYGLIEKNVIHNPSSYSAGYNAIFLTDDGVTFSTHNIVRNNRIVDDSSNMAYGIAENAADDDYNIYEGNYISGAATAAMNILGSHSLVRNNFGFSNVKTVTEDYIMKWADEIILANASSAPLKVTLPDPAAYPGYSLTIKKVDSSTNAVTVEVADTANQTIDGATSKDLTSQYESITVVSDGSNWHIV